MKREIDTREAFEQWLATPARSNEVAFQGLDLTPYRAALLGLDLTGCIFIGCRMPPDLAAHAASFDCVIIPPFPGKPFDAFRTQLYSPDELLSGFDPANMESYAQTLDARIYADYKRRTHSLDDVLARRIHDFSIEDALEDHLDEWAGKGVVGVMGGHAVERGARTYVDIAHLTWRLARDGYLVVSGGGPGIMEAANLGVYFAARETPELNEAIAELSKAPQYTHPDWLPAAFQVKVRFPGPAAVTFRSVGVPTWFYGHEWPNVFATHIAKYFENSVREEGLLAIATRGVIFAEGGAGTLQEIFQNACQNYYRSYQIASPMILFGNDYWNPAGATAPGDRRRKVYPLLKQLASEAGFGDLVFVSDSIEEIAALIDNPLRR